MTKRAMKAEIYMQMNRQAEIQTFIESIGEGVLMTY